MASRKNYYLNVHVGITLKKRLRNLKVANRQNVMFVSHQNHHVNAKELSNYFDGFFISYKER